MTRSDTDKTGEDACPCFVKGCQKEGVFRAPLSPKEATTYIWLCLEHVRQHNARWNYLEGSGPEEIEQKIRHATVWERPTWPFGKGPMAAKPKQSAPRSNDDKTPAKIRDCLGVLDLVLPVTLRDIKARYRHLAKRYHPDANKGNKDNVHKFHEIRQAFATLEKYYAKRSGGLHE